MTGGWTPFILAVSILCHLTFVGLWDLYVTFFAKDDTMLVSHYLRTWATEMPIAALAVGVVIGHLMWPGHVPPKP